MLMCLLVAYRATLASEPMIQLYLTRTFEFHTVSNHSSFLVGSPSECQMRIAWMLTHPLKSVRALVVLLLYPTRSNRSLTTLVRRTVSIVFHRSLATFLRGALFPSWHCHENGPMSHSRQNTAEYATMQCTVNCGIAVIFALVSSLFITLGTVSLWSVRCLGRLYFVYEYASLSSPLPCLLCSVTTLSETLAGLVLGSVAATWNLLLRNSSRNRFETTYPAELVMLQRRTADATATANTIDDNDHTNGSFGSDCSPPSRTSSSLAHSSNDAGSRTRQSWSCSEQTLESWNGTLATDDAILHC